MSGLAAVTPARVLLVGAGKVALDRHLPALRVLGDRIRLVGICDPDERRASDVATATGVPRFGDISHALAATAPEIALVATPPATHVSAVPECLRAGAWVICEKPAARSLAELDVIQAAERETGNPCSFVYQQRFGSTAQLLHRLLDAGELDPPRCVMASTLWFREQEYYQVPWRGSWQHEGGGVLHSLGVHALDLALWLSGEWVEVTAMAASLDRDIGVDNLSAAVVRLASGALLTAVSSALSPREESYLRFDYADATVELTHLYSYRNEDWRLSVRTSDADEPSGRSPADLLQRVWPDRRPDPASDHAAMFAAVLDARRRGEAPPCSGIDGRTAFELVTACYASALTGRAVRRGDIGPSSPFYRRLDGDLEPWLKPAQPVRPVGPEPEAG